MYEQASATVVSRPHRPDRIYEQLAATLEQRILSGDLPDGHRLPTEKELARQSGVSRSTVREALRVLERSGLLMRLSPKVLVVRGRSQQPDYREVREALRRHNATIDHLVEALIVLEPPLAALAAAGADAGDVRDLGSVVDELEQAQSIEAFAGLDGELHSRIAEMSGNPALATARAPIVQCLAAVLCRVLGLAGARQELYRIDRALYEQIVLGDTEAAARASHQRLLAILETCKSRAHEPLAAVLDAEGDGEPSPSAHCADEPAQ